MNISAGIGGKGVHEGLRCCFILYDVGGGVDGCCTRECSLLEESVGVKKEKKPFIVDAIYLPLLAVLKSLCRQLSTSGRSITWHGKLHPHPHSHRTLALLYVTTGDGV